ncbi:Exopolyphosphatase [hydrothermal vent metagenome]|uniref:Exopolyphosphatase n=1 Tax=hydrothermal vent metagenome TaxID=652676 RepID=A0A1W1BNG8_9ZZZZ
MAKRTAVIDIGSNSARLVIYERTSRYGFHLICEQKSRVRIGEGAYRQGGNLQPIGIERAYLALQSFIQTTKKYRVHKILCVATSALRDAPNGREFVAWIREHLKLSIKIIDGNEEAKLGAIATNNLLPIDSGITIDIGGGSSDMALIEGGKIVETCSLNIGTVRLKELFFDHNEPIERAMEYIALELEKIPNRFKSSLAIGIGGSARTLSKAIMRRSDYPLDKLHAFRYSVKDEMDYLTSVTQADLKSLEKLDIKRGRFDTIREGTLIFVSILKKIEAKEVISSGVGVREGLFLKDLLRNSRLQFPVGLNPSTQSILDRFDNLTPKSSNSSHRVKVASRIYQLCHEEFGLSYSYLDPLKVALKLSNIGKTLTIYKSRQHAFYIAMQELNFGFDHKDMLIISLLLRTCGNSLLKKQLFEKYREILPPKDSMRSLSFIYNLTILLHENSNEADINLSYSDKILTIDSNQSLYHAKESIELLERPHKFDIVINDTVNIPRYRF